MALTQARVLSKHGLHRRALAALTHAARDCPALASQSVALAFELGRSSRQGKSISMPEPVSAAFERARDTGQPVMLFLARPTCGLCRFTQQNLKDPKLASSLRHIIKVDLRIDAQENRPLLNQLSAKKSMRMLPFIFYLSPEEEIIDYTSGGQEAAQLAAKFKSVLTQTLGATDSKLRDRFAKEVEKAHALVDNGKCGDAMKAYQAVGKLGIVGEPAKKVQKIIQAIELIGQAHLTHCQNALRASAYDKCVPGLLILESDFAGTRIAGRAKAELERVKAAPKGKEALERWTGAVAGKAAASASEPESAPPVSNPVSERQASSMLSMAKAFLTNKRADLARKHLGQLIAKYPNTKAAREATSIVKSLK
ncbi:MAG: hypothetical protein ISS72_11555 [Candidatus Brocadiae bacterium]|nr:hypothetical protein [Candidatus Brocadiia bacterium]